MLVRQQTVTQTEVESDAGRGIEYRVKWKPADILLHIGCRLRLLAALTSQRSSPCTAASPTVSVPGSPATALCIGTRCNIPATNKRYSAALQDAIGAEV